MRVFCWRVGVVLNVPYKDWRSFKKCVECGSFHEEYTANNCGSYIAGEHCHLMVGHKDSCQTKNQIVEHVMET